MAIISKTEIDLNITTFREKNNLNLILNYLFILFTFVLPLSHRGSENIFIIILLIFIIRGNFIPYIRTALQNKVILAMSFYALTHIVWLFGTEDIASSSWVLKSGLFYLYPIVFISFLDYRFIKHILTAFFLGMLISEIASYGLFFQLLPASFGYYSSYTDPTPFFHHTHYGLILSFTLVMIFQDFFLKKENLSTRIILALFFLTASINLFITGGRTGYVLYLILLYAGALLLFKKQLIKMSIAMSIFLAIAFTSAYNFSTLFQDRVNTTTATFSKIINQEDKFYNTSLGARLVVYQSALGVIEKNLFFGVGTSDHLSEVREYTNINRPEIKHLSNAFFHLHNEYLSIVVQFGIFALIIYLNIFYQIYKYKQENTMLRNMQLILGVAIIFFGLIDIVSNKTELSLVLFVTFISITLLTPANQSIKNFKEKKLF